MVLLKQLWPYILGASILAYILVLHQNIKVYKADLRASENAISFQNAMIETNKAEYEKKLSELPKEIIKIKNHYITKYIEIEKWRERESDCNQSIRYINVFEF